MKDWRWFFEVDWQFAIAVLFDFRVHCYGIAFGPIVFGIEKVNCR